MFAARVKRNITEFGIQFEIKVNRGFHHRHEQEELKPLVRVCTHTFFYNFHSFLLSFPDIQCFPLSPEVAEKLVNLEAFKLECSS